jgi:hypothetical protein
MYIPMAGTKAENNVGVMEGGKKARKVNIFT